MAGIAVGRCPSSNTITFYNPNTLSYYNLPSYCLDKAYHPSYQFFCHIKCDGSTIMGLYRDKHYPTPKPFPPITLTPLICDRETQ